MVTGRYQIERLAGIGGMSEVYKARARDGTPVALKLLRASDGRIVSRFLLESRVFERLKHPGIVRYLDSGVTPETKRHFLVMEWLDGEDLGHRLREQRLSLDACLLLGERVAEALGAVHDAGIVHRDVKPSNIFLCDGKVGRAKLLDFGIAHWDEAGSLTRTGESLGTPAYMPPEQLRGERSLSASADVFALGCVLYECLTGHARFTVGDGPNALGRMLLPGPRLAMDEPGVPRRVAALLERMMAREPAERPQSGAEVAAALRALQAGRDSAELVHDRSVLVERDTLTRQEQRLVSVVVMRPGHAMPDATHDRAAGSADGDDDLAHAPTLAVPAPDIEPLSWTLHEHLDALGARCQFLPGGLMAAVLDNRAITRPDTPVDQAGHAARCALALRAAFPRATVALATMRTIPGKERRIGEVIDSAVALLDAHAGSDGTIWIDEVTRVLLRQRFELQCSEDRGCTLVGERLEGRGPGRLLPFMGRQGELATLSAILDECVNNETARAVLVTGPAGIGKTRLCEELLAEAKRRGITVWRTHGDPMRAGAPLCIMATAVCNAAGIAGSEPPAERRARLRAHAARHLHPGDVDRVTAFLGELIHAAAGDYDDVKLAAARADAQLMGDQIRRACRDLLDAETSAHPLLVVIDDLHWGDRATMEVLDRSLRDLGERPLLVLAMGRPELHDLHPGLWAVHNVTEIRLHRLPRRAAADIVRAGLGRDVEPARVEALVDRADGNPYYLEELIRLGAAGVETLPESVAAMVEARIDALYPEARRVLRAASVFGPMFWAGGVLALVGDDVDVTGWLEALICLDLVVEMPASRVAGEPEYRFRHALLQDGAYRMLVAADRQLGHRLAGAWLRAAGEEDPRILAEHFDRGGEPAQALPFYVRAAEDALCRGDLDGALAMAERGEACRAGGALLGAIRRVQMEEQIWRGDNAQVVRLGSEAVMLLERGTRAWYDTLSEVAAAHAKLAEIDELCAICERLCAGGEPGDDQTGRLIAMAKMAVLGYAFGQAHCAGELLDIAAAGALALARPDPLLLANIHFGRAVAAETEFGDPAQVLIEMQRCLDYFEEIGDTRQVCLHRGNVGYARFALGLHEQAEIDLRAAIDDAERLGLGLAAHGARQKLGLVLAYRGQLADAEMLERQACTWFQEHGDTRMLAMVRLSLATVFTIMGKLASAEREAREALALVTGAAPLRPMALALLARVHLGRGAIDEARLLCAEAVELIDTLDNVENGEELARLVHAEALDAAGDRAGACRAIAHAHARLLARADAIGRAEWRQSFLAAIPENARIVELARAWAGE